MSTTGKILLVALAVVVFFFLLNAGVIIQPHYDWVARPAEVRAVGIGQGITEGPFGIGGAFDTGNGKPAIAKVRVESTKPVIAFFAASPEDRSGWCMQRDVLAAEITCGAPNGRYLVVLDSAAYDAGSTVVTGVRTLLGDREALASNRVSITVFDWKCIEHC